MLARAPRAPLESFFSIGLESEFSGKAWGESIEWGHWYSLSSSISSRDRFLQFSRISAVKGQNNGPSVVYLQHWARSLVM